MPSDQHQTLVRLLTERDEAMRQALSLVGIRVSETLTLRPGPDAVRDRSSAFDLFADGTVVAHGVGDEDDDEAFVVEVQLQPKGVKRFAWLLYVAVIRRRLRCRTTLVVVTPSDAVARWAAMPIEFGRGSVLRPVVIGPQQIPHDLGVEASLKVPGIAVLAVAAHGRGPYAERVGRAAFEAVRMLAESGDEGFVLYLDVIYAFLDPVVLDEIEEEYVKMSTYEPIGGYFKKLKADASREGRMEGRAEGRKEGRAEGQAEALLSVLEARGLGIDERTRARVLACGDRARLGTWLSRAATATHRDEVFGAVVG